MDEYEIVNCIDRALTVFGENVKHQIYWQVTQDMSQLGHTKGILKDPEIFVAALKETFGVGMWAIERQIVREIRTSFELEPEEGDNLTSVMGKARKKLVALEVQSN